MRTNQPDERRMDFVLPDLASVFGGAPLFIDVTCVSPLRADGLPQPYADTRDGAIVEGAAQECRINDYPDAEATPLAELLSVGVETYARWGRHALRLVRALARLRAQNAPAILRVSVQCAYASRWWAILSAGMQRAIVETITFDAGGDLISSEETFIPSNLIDLLDMNR